MRLFDIVHVKEEAPDCFSYILRPADGNDFIYLAGQFITVIVEINDRPQRRAYSISAAPGPAAHCQLTVKKVDNGAVSRYILAHWRPGTRVTALEPAGRFILPDRVQAGDQFVFISAGSGITPVFALLQALIGSRISISLLLLTQFRTTHDIIFRETLTKWRDDVTVGLKWVSLLSRPDEPGAVSERLTNDKLESILFGYTGRDLRKAKYYLCGPLPFMRMALFTLREMGVPENNIRRELFDPPREPATSFTPDREPHMITLTTGPNEARFPARFPDTIMDAAAKAGITIPFSCKAGICSTCVLRCVSGSVKMRINEVLTDADLEAGLVLTCVGYAIDDLVLEIG